MAIFMGNMDDFATSFPWVSIPFFQVIITKSGWHPFFYAVVGRELRSLKNWGAKELQSEFPTT
jgi:hypothetical protein